jgi:hypothetical protein
MELKTFTIQFSSLSLFKACMTISHTLHSSGIINLEIHQDKIISTTSTSSDSCYKHWVLGLDKFGKTSDELASPIKCSIFAASDFTRKILPALEQKDTTSYITFLYDELLNVVKQIEVSSINSKGKKIFSMKFVTSDVSLVYTDFDDETIDFFFNENCEIPTTVYEFNLYKDDIKKMKSLLNLNIRDDAQNTYLSIRFDNSSNQIVFTDEITKFCLIDESIIQSITEDVCKKTFDIDKAVFKLVDDINYKVKILEYEGSSFICFHHINEAIKYVTTIPLLENVNTSITYDDILKDKGTFG